MRGEVGESSSRVRGLGRSISFQLNTVLLLPGGGTKPPSNTACLFSSVLASLQVEVQRVGFTLADGCLELRFFWIAVTVAEAVHSEATLLAASQRPQTPRDWEQWLATTRKTIDVVWNTANPDAAAPHLVHLNCNQHRQPPGLA